MTVVSDGFNRADSTNLGASWAEVVGDWAIVSNQVECNNDAGDTGYYARYESDVGSSDMYSEAVTNSTQTNGTSNAGVAVRMRAAANTSYQLTTNLNDNHAFWRIVSGSENQIATFSSVLAAGDTIRVEAVGRTLRGKINASLVGLAQDANITDGQRPGLNGYNNVGTDVVRLDNFEGGALTDDLVAAYIADWSAQTARSTGASMTPTIPAQVAAGDLVCVLGTVRSVTDTISFPAGEGWSQEQLASGNSLGSYVFAKVWGLGGQTDDTTPTFTRTGTTGAFVSAFVIRNPLHSTTPWTSVASAIVASAQQSNAAAATATAAAASHTGTNCTVVRCYSSADDNALGTTSEGMLVFGGAAYDATDIAQACTILEDVTLSGSTATATVAETVNGNDANNGITLVVAIPTAAAEEGAGLLSGGGVLLGTGTRTVNGIGAVSGGGTATGTGTRTVSGAASLAGGGSLTAAGVEIQTGAGALGGGGVLTAAGLRTVPGQAAATGGGTLTASGTRTVLGSAALTGDGALSATGVQEEAGAAALDGGGALSASGVRTALGSGALTGGGTLTASGTRTAGGVGTLAGGGTLEASGQISGEPITGSAALDGGGSFTGSGTVTRHGQATLIGGGGLAASGQVIGEDIEGEGALTGAGTLSATGVVTRQGAATLSGGGALVVVGRRTVTGSAVLDGGGSLTASGPAAVIGTVRYLTRARPVVAASSTAEPTVDMEVTLT